MRGTVAQSGDWCENTVISAGPGAGDRGRVSAGAGKLDERDFSLHVFRYQNYKRTQLERKVVAFFFFFKILTVRVVWLWLSGPEKGSRWLGPRWCGGKSWFSGRSPFLS